LLRCAPPSGCLRQAVSLRSALDGRTLQSVPESGGRAGYDGYKRKRGSKVHVAVDTLGHLLAVTVTPANEQERAQVGELCRQVQEATRQTVQAAFVDQGYTGQEPAQQAQEHGIDLLVVKLEEAKKGFVLLPRRWTSSPTKSRDFFMVCLWCAGSFIGAAPAVIPHWRLCTAFAAQPASLPLLQAHRFLFPPTLRSQGGQP